MGKRYGVVACVAVALACVVLSGCVSLSRTDKENLRTIRDAGLGITDESVKSPLAAGFLNVLPGVGNFYLSYGTEEPEQVLVGFINLLFWPVSILWGIPEAAVDANTLNKRETIYYYYRTDAGREKLQAAIDRTKAMPPITP